jgi:hypothetical protein
MHLIIDCPCREAQSDAELQSIGWLRARSFYAYPPERAFAGQVSAYTEQAPLQDCSGLSTDTVVHLMHICAWQTWLHALLQHAWACADSSDHDS